MAEIFGAIASGAGLVSLSMQLLESAQKLKGFYDTSRDAPDTVRRLCFELETMSLSLRQFESHRQSDILGNELLDRCIMTCHQAIAKIKTAVDKVDRLLHKSKLIGKAYMGFREPEVRGLLEEMEHAKSSMSLAYMSYCQSWNMRENARNATALQDALSSIVERIDQQHLANAAIISRHTSTASQAGWNFDASSPHMLHQSRDIKTTQKRRQQTKDHRFCKLRLPLPRWFVDCVWDFELRKSDGAWTARLSSVNLRPNHAYVFEIVQSGDVTAVRNALRSGAMSLRDQRMGDRQRRGKNLLEIAAANGQVKLCEFFLQETSMFHEDDIIHSAFHEGLRYFGMYLFHDAAHWKVYMADLSEAFFRCFITNSNMSVDLRHSHSTSDFRIGADASWSVTENSFQQIIANQSITLRTLPTIQQFYIIMDSYFWPADDFLKLFENPNSSANLATVTDESSRTALHWAAEHLGYALHTNDPLGRATGYRRVIVQLLKMGADIHAVYSGQGRSPLGLTTKRGNDSIFDPFLAFLDGVDFSWRLVWSEDQLAMAVLYWGQVLSEGGVCLFAYATAVNKFLDTVSFVEGVSLADSRGVLIPVELVVALESQLVLRVTESTRHGIWKAQTMPVPGAWPSPLEFPDTIIWYPEQQDERVGYEWTEVDELWTYSEPYLLRSANVQHRSQADSLAGAFNSSRGRLLQQSQDDHGPIHLMKLRAIDTKSQPRRRTASAPPAVSTWMKVSLAARQCVEAHKCPFDGRWTICQGLRFSWQDWRECMKGSCVAHANARVSWAWAESWERDLFLDEDHVQVAKRFAERFRPEGLGAVKQTEERAEQRARLQVALL